MKIGLIGINMYPKYLNFACPLHTYAFQQFLLQNGIKSTVIDYKPVYFGGFDMRHPADYYKKQLNKQEKKKASTPEAIEEKESAIKDLQEKVQDWEALYTEREIRYDKFQKFIDDHYIKTEETYDSDLLETKDPGFDCYICVTDVIWNLLPRYTYDRGFFLASKAMEGKQKISYAASRGVPRPYTDEQKALFFNYVTDIDSISVREESLKTFIEENSDREATVVLDPVLLHDKAFWQKLSIKPEEEKYIVLYYVMEKAADTINRAVEYAKKHDLQIIELSDRPVKGGRVKDDTVKHISRYDVGMEEWLGYLEHAECIFTNSFHGICFSVLFEKIFYVGNRNGDKVTNILNTFGLLERKMPDSGIPLDTMPQTIDYDAVRDRLDKKRAESKDFILSALQDAERRVSEGEKKDTTHCQKHRNEILYPVKYHSGKPDTSNSYDSAPEGFLKNSLSSGNVEYSIRDKQYKNDGSSFLDKNRYELEGYQFMGWNLRVKIDTKWFWLMEDGTLAERGKAAPKQTTNTKNNGIFQRIFRSQKPKEIEKKRALLSDEAAIPHIPVNRIQMVIVEAKWKQIQ